MLPDVSIKTDPCQSKGVSVGKLFFLFFLFGVPNLVATTYYVSPAGNDNNPGSSSAPWATFAHANSIVQPGDTVIAADGTYVEQPYITHGGNSALPVTYKAQNKWGSVIAPTSTQANARQNAGSGVVFWITASYVTVDGFELAGPSDGTAGHGFSIESGSDGMSATNTTLTRNKIHHIGTSTKPCVWGGGITSFSANSLFDSNYLYDIGAEKFGCAPIVNGMYIDDGNGQTITNNIFVAMWTDGIWIQSNGSYDATFPSNLNVSNNTFVNVYDDGIAMRCNYTGPCNNNKFNNNILVNVDTVPNNGDVIFQSCGGGGTWGTNNTFDHNLIFSSASTTMCTSSLTNTVTGNPQFVSNTGDQTGNYNLCAGAGVGASSCSAKSAAIDSATSAGAPSHDFDGNGRPQGGFYDIGAYEFVSVSDSPSAPTGLTAIVN
jgi:hypothetical protein